MGLGQCVFHWRFGTLVPALVRLRSGAMDDALAEVGFQLYVEALCVTPSQVV